MTCGTCCVLCVQVYPQMPYAVDDEVQLVCKYLNAYKITQMTRELIGCLKKVMFTQRSVFLDFHATVKPLAQAFILREWV